MRTKNKGQWCGLPAPALLTLQEMLGECNWQVTMNNTLCLGVFLLVIYQQRLPWVYSSEVAVILGASLSTCQHPVTGRFCK